MRPIDIKAGETGYNYSLRLISKDCQRSVDRRICGMALCKNLLVQRGTVKGSESQAPYGQATDLARNIDAISNGCNCSVSTANGRISIERRRRF